MPETSTTDYYSVRFGVLGGLQTSGLVSSKTTIPEVEAEDKIEEFRLIIFPTGGNTSIVNLFVADLGQNNRRVVFKLKKKARYDFYLIANESASGQKATDLAFLSHDQISRSELENVRSIQMINVSSEKQKSGLGSAIMMTALYKNVPVSESLRGNGTEFNPYIIDLTEFNRLQRRHDVATDRSSAELMRSLAKVELTLKGVVAIRPHSQMTLDNPKYEYSWILPYGYKDDSKLLIEVLNTPKSYTLFPCNLLTDITTVGVLPPYQFSFNDKPDPNYVVLPDLSDSSIGGIYVGDYVITIYLPEYLASESLAEEERPEIKITYHVDGKTDKQSKIYPFQNKETNLQPTDYETALEGLPQRPLWNIYRNRLYKIKVNIFGKEF